MFPLPPPSPCGLSSVRFSLKVAVFRILRMTAYVSPSYYYLILEYIYLTNILYLALCKHGVVVESDWPVNNQTEQA